MSGPVVEIPIANLRIDPDYQPRDEGLAADNVARLCASDPATWPPLLVAAVDDGFVVLDGWHRLAAARRLHLAALPCLIAPQADYEAAFNANLAHGLPLSKASRKAFARWLHGEHPEMSARELGRRAGLSDKTVKAVLTEGSSAEIPHDTRRAVNDAVRLVDAAIAFRKRLFGTESPARAARRLAEYIAEHYSDDDAAALAADLAACGETLTLAAERLTAER